MTTRTTLQTLLALALALTAVAAPVAAQSADLTVDVSAEVNDDGDAATVTFSVHNAGDASAAILNVTDRPDWSIAERNDAGGAWQADGEKWLFQTVGANETVSPSLTLTVPEDPGDNLSVEAMVTSGESTDTASASVDLGGLMSFASGPGFGALSAVIALLAVAALARLRE